jgi:hypothetical protein
LIGGPTRRTTRAWSMAFSLQLCPSLARLSRTGMARSAACAKRASGVSQFSNSCHKAMNLAACGAGSNPKMRVTAANSAALRSAHPSSA